MNYWQNWNWCCIYDSTYDLFSVCPCVCPGPDSLWYQPPTARGGSKRSSHWKVAVCAQQVNIRWKLWLQFKLSAWKSCQLSLFLPLKRTYSTHCSLVANHKEKVWPLGRWDFCGLGQRQCVLEIIIWRCHYSLLLIICSSPPGCPILRSLTWPGNFVLSSQIKPAI